ncbi:hypothetical protein BC941DRAFT_452105 [Chlamydoabsidia padenii]|nr:hypothetical protein BC941DRAFT_452105 [Chlamydoabsidia padenii]
MSDKTTREELIDRCSHDKEAQSRLERVIVISIDSSSANYILEWALANFLQPHKDMVVLINVRKIDASIGSYVHPTRIVEEFDPQNKASRNASIALLKEYIQWFRQRQIACQAFALAGDPKEEIIRKVKEIRADVLLMGSRNLGPVKRAFVGSVSDYCVHHCPCAVVVARPQEDEVEKGSRRRSIFSIF